jgi:hypothetical protein
LVVGKRPTYKILKKYVIFALFLSIQTFLIFMLIGIGDFVVIFLHQLFCVIGCGCDNLLQLLFISMRKGIKKKSVHIIRRKDI